jgi:hypothetical protein
VKRLAVALLLASTLLLACGGDDKEAAQATDESSDAKTDQRSDQKTDDTDDFDADAAGKRAINSLDSAMATQGFKKDSEGSDDDSDSPSSGAASDEEDSDEEDSDDPFVFTSPDCKEFEALIEAGDGAEDGTSLKSAEFVKGVFDGPGTTEETLQASLFFASDDSELSEVFGLFTDGRLGKCLEEGLTTSMNAELPAGASVTAESAPVDLGDIGDDRQGIDLKLTLTVEGTEIPLDLNFFLASQDRVGVVIFDTILGADAPTVDLAAQLELLLDEATK